MSAAVGSGAAASGASTLAPGSRRPTAWGLRNGFNALDARYFQIAFLVTLLLFGALARDFALSGTQVLLAFASAALTQAFWQFALQLPQRKSMHGYLSAVVTACGISILVRSDTAWVHPTLAGLWMLALGATVTGRISRWGVSFTFLATWLGLYAVRLA